MTLVLNSLNNDHISPIKRSMLIYDDRIYETFDSNISVESPPETPNKTLNLSDKNIPNKGERKGYIKENMFNTLYSKICILIDNEPFNIPIWGINSLYSQTNNYSNEEIDFIYFNILRYNDNLYKINFIDIDNLIEKTIKHYCYYRKFISWESYFSSYPVNTKILRFYSSIDRFKPFYRGYGSYNLSTSFEFDLSKQELSTSNRGTWLLRKSSLSRVSNIKDESQREEALENIKKYLIEFYALSWKKFSGTFHVRFIFVPWKGWCVLREPNSFDLSVAPPSFKGKWFVCFIDCLEYLMARHNLNF